VVRRREAVDELKGLGGDLVFSSSDGPIDEQVRRALGSEGVRYAIDPVGGETGTQVFQALAPEGRMLVFGTLSQEPLRIDPRLMIAGKRVVEGFWLGHWMRERSIPSALLLFREIARLMRAGILATDVGATFPLEQIAEAARMAESVGHRGKVLLRIGER
jgi:NADPH:quinone reductase